MYQVSRNAELVLCFVFVLLVMGVGHLTAQESDQRNVIKPENGTDDPVFVKSEAPIVIGTTLKIQSKVWNGERELNIWLPPTYSDKPNQKFPVLYIIDGGIEQDFHHISGLSQLASINNDYQTMIVVGIKTQGRIDELTQKPKDPRYIRVPARGGKSGQFMGYIAEEVIPLIEKRYRTSDRRAVVGESLAGLFIAEVFLRRPSIFTDYISISPSLWWDDKALARESADLLTKHDDKRRKLYLTMANEGGTMQGGLDLIMKSIKENKPAGLEWSYVDRRESETHSTIYHGATQDALRKLFGLTANNYEEPIPWYLIEGGHPKDESEDK